MEKYRFIGKNINEDDKKEATKILGKAEVISNGLLNYELVKTKEEISLINYSNNLIKDELTSLGVQPVPIKQGNIHIYNKQDDIAREYNEYKGSEYQRLIDENYSSGISGSYDPFSNSINIFVLRKPKLAFLENLLQVSLHRQSLDSISKFETVITTSHEGIHKNQFSSFKIHKDADNAISDYRVGYNYSVYKKDNKNKDDKKSNLIEDYEHFLMFNEAVTQKTVNDAMIKHRKELEKDLNIPVEEFDKIITRNLGGTYTSPQAILDVIIKRIAKKKNTSEEEVWKKIKKGQFTGEMMHLRDIEDVYGPGSLRVLASMNMKDDFLNVLDYLDYFKSESIEAREVIAQRILNEKEKKNYDTHRKLMDK